MNERKEEAVRGQIVSLLAVFGGGILAAFLIAAYFVTHYGPSGRYEVANVLLAPDLLHQLNYNDTNPKTGGTDRFVFDRIEFAYLDPAKKTWSKLDVSEEKYAQFYQLVQGEMSAINPKEIEGYFSTQPASILTLFVKTESSASWQKIAKIFQEIQFAANGDYFRIQLHEQNPGESWAYFNHPLISKETLSLFLK